MAAESTTSTALPAMELKERATWIGQKNEQLDPHPRVHANGNYMNLIPDMRFFRVIKYGGRAMNFSHIMLQWQHILSDEDILDVIAHIRTLANPPYEPGMVKGCMIPVPENERTGPFKK